MRNEIPYIESLPTHWSIIQNRFLFQYDGKKVGNKFEQYQLLSLTTSGVKQRNINDAGGKVPASYDNYQTVRKGQMVFCLFDLDCSAVFSGISKYDGMITSAYDVFSSTGRMNNSFADYWFKYVFSNRYYKMFSKSIRYTITGEMFRSLKTPVPPMDEQKRISAFLHEQETKVNALIANVELQIEKLKSYKQSLITEVVTKGLNPSAPMKDSGIEWIGEIPEHWSLIRFKDKWQNIKEVAGNSSEEYERLALTLSGVIKRPKEDSEGLQPKAFDGYQILRENNFIFKMIDLQNISTSRVGLSSFTGLVSPAYIRFVPKKEGQFPKYIYYFLMSMYYNCVYNNLGGNGVRSALNASDMGNFVIPFPDEDEQRSIVEFLDKNFSQIDRLISLKQAKIDKLNEYKKSLIYEYVTGKKAV